MIAEALVVLLLAAGLEGHLQVRGPHHPRSERATGHHHYHPTPPKPGAPSGAHPSKLTQDEHLLHDQEHIKEDLEGLVSEETMTNMTPNELEFHYFKIHDMDNNTKLDGLEMLQAILHVAPADTEGKSEEENKQQKDYELQYYISIIDRVLEEDDLDHDGYLNYIEYVSAKNKRDTVDKDAATHMTS